MLGEPYLVGQNPAFSTSVGLVKRYPLIWDTNFYYRSLGVSPWATKRQLKWAYRKRRGWRSPWLTYVLKQLLDPRIRSLYDATPLGQVFWDEYVEEAARRKTVAESVRFRMVGNDEVADAILRGYEDLEDEEYEDLPVAPSRRYNEPWLFGYYLWDSNLTDTARLRDWQRDLIGAFAERKDVRELAVGFVGSSLNPFEVRRVGYRMVAFLSEGSEPTVALAEQAASTISSMEITK